MCHGNRNGQHSTPYTHVQHKSIVSEHLDTIQVPPVIVSNKVMATETDSIQQVLTENITRLAKKGGETLSEEQKNQVTPAKIAKTK